MASITKVYARAFADVVTDRRLHSDKVLAEAQSLASLMSESKELREVWHAPSIPAEQKRKLLDAIAARDKISTETRNFVAVLIDHRRINFLPAIVKEFEQELNQRLGFAEAEITSARELNPTERQAVEAQVAKLTGKKVRANYLRDGTILGGAIVKIGSTIYDGSVKGQLEKIREQLAGTV
jgi:F-type H+-transporting ATPase subunit delta